MSKQAMTITSQHHLEVWLPIIAQSDVLVILPLGLISIDLRAVQDVA